MDLKELQEAMKDESFKTQFHETFIKPVLDPIVSKKEELLNELKTVKGSKTEVETKLNELLEAQKHQQGDFKSLYESEKSKRETELKTLSEQLESERTYVKSALLNSTMSDLMSKYKVAPHFVEAVKAMISGKMEIVSDGSNRKVVSKNDKGEAVDVDVFMKSFVESEVGKHFVLGDGSSGGGLNGSGANDGKFVNPFETGNLTEQANLRKTNPALFEKLRAEHKNK